MKCKLTSVLWQLSICQIDMCECAAVSVTEELARHAQLADYFETYYITLLPKGGPKVIVVNFTYYKYSPVLRLVAVL